MVRRAPSEANEPTKPNGAARETDLDNTVRKAAPDTFEPNTKFEREHSGAERPSGHGENAEKRRAASETNEKPICGEPSPRRTSET